MFYCFDSKSEIATAKRRAGIGQPCLPYASHELSAEIAAPGAETRPGESSGKETPVEPPTLEQIRQKLAAVLRVKSVLGP